MLTRGTGRSAGQCDVPKHASAACAIGQMPKDWQSASCSLWLIVAALALERQPQGVHVQLAAGARIGRDQRHSREELDVHATSSFGYAAQRSKQIAQPAGCGSLSLGVKMFVA